MIVHCYVVLVAQGEGKPEGKAFVKCQLYTRLFHFPAETLLVPQGCVRPLLKTLCAFILPLDNLRWWPARP